MSSLFFYRTSKRRDMPTKYPELFFDSTTLERETVTKVLDVFINENLAWKAYIKTISTNTFKSVSMIYKAKLINPRKQLNQLYFSFVHSYLKYANLTWGFYPEKQIVYSLLSTKVFNYVAKFLRSVHTLQTSF